ncbi:unnamed protein product [Chondrus crispus]|uniref:Uncharacterized protein n=1 Tax=Chondrus crispus TaxID=2769 RepID=R7QNH8_CHOCR|nr:unnamed protein product [Chondrus crispus]CDF39011.1 unnamed protein product [Chondrus crispus]|eukprot:XP_005718916.1 unnamed protein product [Chondrus crispus]
MGSSVSDGASDSVSPSGEASTLSGEADTVSGDADTVSGDADTVSGDADTVSGDADTVSGDADTVSGDADTVSGDADTVSGWDVGPKPPSASSDGLISIVTVSDGIASVRADGSGISVSATPMISSSPGLDVSSRVRVGLAEGSGPPDAFGLIGRRGMSSDTDIIASQGSMSAETQRT